jgi:hypothetical protein
MLGGIGQCWGLGLYTSMQGGEFDNVCGGLC